MNPEQTKAIKLWLKNNKPKPCPNRFGYAEPQYSAKPKDLWDAV